MMALPIELTGETLASNRDIPDKFRRIHVEISNSCNLKCTFCPAVERGRQILSPEQFSDIVAKVGHRSHEIALHLLGEPLTHPELAEILEQAERHKVPIHVVTNGMLINQERTDLLLRPIVRQVGVSLQSFVDNFPDQNPRAYVGRIKSFIDQALVRRPDLYINLRFWDLETPHQKVAAQVPEVTILKELLAEALEFSWDDVCVDIKRRKNWQIRGRIYLHFDSRFTWPHPQSPVLQEKGTCYGLKNHIGIHADGTVVPCCLDHRGDIPLGNIFDQTIEQILSSPRAKAMRDGFATGKLTEDLCRRCGFIKRFARKAAKLDVKSGSKLKNLS